MTKTTFPDGRMATSISLSPEMSAAIDNVFYHERFRNKSDAMRYLLDIGVRVYEARERGDQSLETWKMLNEEL